MLSRSPTPLPTTPLPLAPAGTGWLDVQIFRGEEAAVHRLAGRLFGRRLGLWEYAGLAGAPDDALVELGTLAGELYIEVGDPAGRVYRAVERVRLTSGGPVLVIDALHIFRRRMQRRGLGFRMLRRQLACAKRLGVQSIETRAGRSADENGYYTWPRLGFDGPLPPEILAVLPRGTKDGRRVLDLIATERGRRWWLAYGTTIDVVFDLSEQSLSWKAFAEYALSRRKGGHLAPVLTAAGLTRKLSCLACGPLRAGCTASPVPTGRSVCEMAWCWPTR